jgi:tRNA(Ile)-lysidine synthase
MKGSVVVDRIQGAVNDALPTHERSLLAVSGGMDSMVLLHAARAVRPAAAVIVATFDHASGQHAAAAVDLVQRVAMTDGVPIVIGRGTPRSRPSEAGWRSDRMSFLRAAAREHCAVISTAHTRDDQVETVLFREMRGAGPRGLAGLAADSGILRPILTVARRDVSDYARAAGVEWVDDPTNLDTSFSRNRIRRDLIPAMRAAHPDIDDDLFRLGARAARWRSDLDAYLQARIRFDVDRELETLEVSRESLHGFADDALGILWPALLGRLGVAADWRGTQRLVAFTTRGRTGQRIQLSGGWNVLLRRRRFEVRRAAPDSQR